MNTLLEQLKIKDEQLAEKNGIIKQLLAAPGGK